jgi:hypothetical protein
MDNCLWLAMQRTWFVFSFALLKAGSNIAARMAMMAITTRSSINVKPLRVTRPKPEMGKGLPPMGMRDALHPGSEEHPGQTRFPSQPFISSEQ